jgi:hypothetical protein
MKWVSCVEKWKSGIVACVGGRRCGVTNSTIGATDTALKKMGYCTGTVGSIVITVQ